MKKIITSLLVALCLSMTVPAVSPGTQIVTVEAASKGKLKLQNGKYYYYLNGKKVKKQWKTINGKRYYFKKDGSAATLSTKINGKYYVFNKKGHLLKATKYTKQLYKIGTDYYRVNKNGVALKGWSKDKKCYYGANGKRLNGIQVINEKFYMFNDKGFKNNSMTKSLQKAAKYEKDFTELKSLIGEPKKATYMTGCYGDGKDGYLEYENFVVYTYRAKDGTEIFMGAE